MDNELFELCKEVYERTGWEADPTHNYGGKAEKYEHRYGKSIFYTSDYLLEKMPLQMIKYQLSYSFFRQRWELNGKPRYGGGRIIGDTPLKALLKLTIALDDAGEIK